MRILFAILVGLHGAAHFIGFAAPWGLVPRAPAGAAPPPSLNSLFGGRVALGETAARSLGLLWLGAGVAFVIVAIAVWRRTPHSGAALAVMSLASLALCIAWWPVARIGAWIDLAILAILVGTAIVSFRRDIALAMARVEQGATTIHTRRGPVEYASVGTGPVILSIHGTGGGWDQGLSAASAMAPAGYRIIAPSRFGYLGTPMVPDPSPAAEADLFAAFLDQMGIDRVTVMSFSAGTAPAIQFALRHPQRVSALVLVVPAAGGILPPQSEGPPPFVMKVVLRHDFPFWAAMQLSRKTMYRVVGMPPALVESLRPAEAAEVEASVRSILPVSRRAKGMINDARSQSGALTPFPLEQLAVPTLLITAEDDLYGTSTVARHAAGIIQGAQLLSFPTGGHLLAGRRHEIQPLLHEFLQARRMIAESSPATALAGR